MSYNTMSTRTNDSLWALTYDFLYSKNKELCYEWEYLTGDEHQGNVADAQLLLGDKWEDFKEYIDGIDSWKMSDVKRYLNR